MSGFVGLWFGLKHAVSCIAVAGLANVAGFGLGCLGSVMTRNPNGQLLGASAAALNAMPALAAVLLGAFAILL